MDLETFLPTFAPQGKDALLSEATAAAAAEAASSAASAASNARRCLCTRSSTAARCPPVGAVARSVMLPEEALAADGQCCQGSAQPPGPPPTGSCGSQACGSQLPQGEDVLLSEALTTFAVATCARSVLSLDCGRLGTCRNCAASPSSCAACKSPALPLDLETFLPTFAPQGKDALLSEATAAAASAASNARRCLCTRSSTAARCPPVGAVARSVMLPEEALAADGQCCQGSAQPPGPPPTGSCGSQACGSQLPQGEDVLLSEALTTFAVATCARSVLSLDCGSLGTCRNC